MLGIPAIAFAFAGSQWSALDATEAMRAGIAAGALAATEPAPEAAAVVQKFDSKNFKPEAYTLYS